MTPEVFKALGVIEKLEVLESYITSIPKAEIKTLLGLSRVELSHLLRLSKRLGAGVRSLIKKNDLPQGYAKAITRLPHSAQDKVIRDALLKGWSVRRIEEEVRVIAEGREAVQDSSYYRQLGELIGDQIGNPVTVKPNKNNKGGELVIRYFDYADFDSVLDRLRVKLPE